MLTAWYPLDAGRFLFPADGLRHAPVGRLIFVWQITGGSV
jgi:hypothetical protein